MSRLRISISKIIDTFVYIALSLLGLYFIYEGHILEKYRSKKTSYAEYDEEITELPTMVTYIDKNIRNQFKYGKDFNISFGRVSTPKNLTDGVNIVDGDSGLKVDFERLLGGNVFKIMPINFSPGMKLSYKLSYYFTKVTQMFRVYLHMASENYSIDLDYDKEYDGSRKKTLLYLGDRKKITLTAIKHVFLKSMRDCRDEPHNEVVLKMIAENIPKVCDHPCRAQYHRNLGKRLESKFRHLLLPICTNKDGEKCYWNFLHDLEDKEPCTKVDYEIKWDLYKNETEKEAHFELKRSHPAKVHVKEEYLIYDNVALVSSIGGTLSLCIGISFYNLYTILRDWTMKEIGRMRC